MQEEMVELMPNINVSRETFEKLKLYEKLVKSENEIHNLIAKSTIDNIWSRHILDSVQLRKFLKISDKVVDLGSGGGFPAIIMSILGIKDLSLIESRGKKANFLKKVKDELGLSCKIICGRVEEYDFKPQTIVTSRAFAPLTRTFSYLQSDINKIEKMILLKGESFQNEVDEVKKFWTFKLKLHNSETNSGGKILEISNIKNASNSDCKSKGRCR